MKFQCFLPRTLCLGHPWVKLVTKECWQLIYMGIAKANEGKYKGCLGRVLKFKLGFFVISVIAWYA